MSSNYLMNEDYTFYPVVRGGHKGRINEDNWGKSHRLSMTVRPK